MLEIIPIVGRVKFPITLDPSSWIFDDRKIALEDFLADDFDLDRFLEEQKDERAGAAMPRLAKSRRRYNKEEWLTRSFVIPVKPFIENAEPLEGAAAVIFETADGKRTSLPLETVMKGAFQFSRDGKILKEDGPLVYLDKQAPDKPVTHITRIHVE
ncbi:hypothetical protein [Caenibacillus caldisaponilyticus]|jgi:hypothetical protein|uniref:hypothetical protein n=1 Tax=Caenibacillus caldisaponilyticus TaxID=1674942 RepID=UPI000988369F|nr:hypothetical protein [Caenibacillus caldisaponilyticus]